MQPQTSAPSLVKGDALPFFDVTTVTGEKVRYADLWQHKNVLLVRLPAVNDADDERYAAEMSRHAQEFETYAAATIVTRDEIKQVPCPGVVIADRWGEIQYLASPGSARDLPDVREIIDTLDFVQRRCPECEGEWR